MNNSALIRIKGRITTRLLNRKKAMQSILINSNLVSCCDFGTGLAEVRTSGGNITTTTTTTII